MVGNKQFIYILISLFFTTISFAQTIELKGQVVAKSDVENIHVMNKTRNKFTTTNAVGEFSVLAAKNDTIVFSSVTYKLKLVKITQKHIIEKKIVVQLDENVNELDEVVVGKVLTGDLNSDIMNSDAKRPIDFYDVGIPGYTGPKKTQNERRLYEADAGKYVTIGLGVGVNLNKILNAITGRTKRLKKRVHVERSDVLIGKVKALLPDDFFEQHPLDEALRSDFFYFCTDDPLFQERCLNKSDLEVYTYMIEKIKEYKKNITEKDD